MPDPAPDPTRPAYEQPDPERPATATPTEPELEAETLRARHDPYAALRSPAYRLFSAGWMAAVIGQQATAAALGWEIAARTGKSTLALGWLAGVQVIPLVLLALPAGVLADRLDRRRVIQVTAFLNALCAVGLALLSMRPDTLWAMYALVIASATALTLGRPARSAILPATVPPSAFSNAVTWNSSFFQLSTMFGLAFGGLLIGLSLRWFGSLALPYAFEAVAAFSYVLVVARMPPETGRAKGAPASADRPSAVAQLSAGLRFVWHTKIILATLTLDLFAVLLGGAVYLLPIFAQEILRVGPAEYGWLRAAEAIGAFAMAVTIAHRPPMEKAGRAMLLAVAGFGAATIVFGLSRSYWLSLLAIAAIGALDNISVVVRHTLVQVLTPDAMRGRVSAVNNIFIGASNELGGLESGLTAWAFSELAVRLGHTPAAAEVLGPTWSVVAGGIGTILVVLLTAWAFPGLRKYGRLQPH